MHYWRKIKRRFIGGRLIKTGIAVLLTAFICGIFDLPQAFAVITAIVTLEPTAAASIRKGAQRLPATVIGAALAMLTVYLFGPTPITYMIASVLTLYFCNMLRLRDGMLVATITAVAMIPTASDHYFLTFVERVGTTFIGLAISTVINLTILPPKFSSLLAEQNRKMFVETAEIFELRLEEVMNGRRPSAQVMDKYHQLENDLERAIQLSYYQQEEWKYHKKKDTEARRFTREQRQLHFLERISYHINRLFNFETDDCTFTKEEVQLIGDIIPAMSQTIHHFGERISDEQFRLIERLDRCFWKKRQHASRPNIKKYHHHFSTDVIIIFALLSIHDVLEELEELHFPEQPEQQQTPRPS